MSKGFIVSITMDVPARSDASTGVDLLSVLVPMLERLSGTTEFPDGTKIMAARAITYNIDEAGKFSSASWTEQPA